MPAEVQNGTGILFGISNSGSAITLEGYATFILETTKGQHKFKLEAVEDETGFDRSLIATNAHVEIDITWTPSGATRAAAAETAVFLTPLSKVALANFAVVAFNGDWVYVGDLSIDLSHKQGKMQLKLRKYDDADQNTSLTTTVSG
jgi:hypothetical protein